MSDIPCKTCLVFPICKAQVDEYIALFKVVPVYDKLYIAYATILKNKCELIVNWIDSECYVNRKAQVVNHKFIINIMKEIYLKEYNE